MADKNTTEVSDAIQALAAVVGEAEFKQLIDDNFAKSVVFKKDVADTDVSSFPTKAIVFTDIDYIAITQTGNVSYSFTGINQGNIKYLKITKIQGATIAFTGAVDVSQRKAFIDSGIEEVIYKITNKDGDLFIESVNIPNETTPYLTKEIEIGDWNMDATSLVLVNHGLTFSKIRAVRTTIRTDDDDDLVNLEVTNSTTSAIGGDITTGTTQVALARATGGFFDQALFDATSFNRGWIIIEYLP